MAFRNPILGGNDELVRDKIRSSNYVPGVSGWQIERNGNAEFNDITVRGRVEVGPDGGHQIVIDTVDNQGTIEVYTHADTEGGPGLIQGTVGNEGLANEFVSMAIYSPRSETADDRIRLGLFSQNADGTSDANIQIAHLATPGNPAGDLIMTADRLEVNILKELACFSRVTIVANLELFGDLIVDGKGGKQFSQKTASQNFVNTTMTAVTNMSFIAKAGKKYLIKVRVAYDSTAASDIRFDWTGPAGFAMDRSILAPQLGSTTNINTAMIAIWRAETTAQSAGGTAGVANAFTAWWEDDLVIGGAADGTVQLRASCVAGVGPATVQSGYIMAEQID